MIICLISEEAGSYRWRLKHSVWRFHSLHSNCISRPDLYTNTECYYYFQLYFHLLLSARVFIIVASIFSLTVTTSLHSAQQKCDQFAKYLSNSRSEPQHSSFSTIARGWRCIYMMWSDFSARRPGQMSVLWAIFLSCLYLWPWKDLHKLAKVESFKMNDCAWR